MSRKLITLTIFLGVGALFFGVSWWMSRQELATRTAELSSLRIELITSQQELGNTQRELAASEMTLLQAKDRVDALETELISSKEQLSTAEAELEITADSLVNVRLELEAAQSKISAMDAGMFNLYNPTLDQVLSFLERDKTDTDEYIEGKYVCSHFVADVNRNAEDKGIRCAFVDIRFPESAHAIVAFETIDEGIVYFDPITDDRVRPVIGKHFYKCIEPKPGYRYNRPDFDDTIMDIMVIW